ncbi:TfoX/Sxy family protein [Nakamurella endophytica]|uniref:TfoX N-terminal domain-containing protein n=1 Tax=Nakamurella endophytica TaxID=1748367 RepID=A0A917SNY8_9ACTN|nr:TfoX/Sxy family protein [Nakamurella endophytica]GGL91817.1 hypothetical protein GCM10011594_09510 [Nakamurella endophytica]
MPYDRALADRIRALLDDQPDLTEKAMFGGLAFLVGGAMAVAAGSQGDVMVRVDPAESDGLVADGGAHRMVMRGREMDGWLRVPAAHLDDAALERWVRRGVARASSLRST